MKKLLFAATLMGSLNAACVDVMTPPIKTHCTMRLLEQDLGSACGNLPFNSDFDWNSLTEKSVEASLKRLMNPSIFTMLEVWKDSMTLGRLSVSIMALLSKDIGILGFSEKKKLMKHIIKNLSDLWQQVPLF